MARALRRIVCVIGASGALACASVPDIQFVGPDAQARDDAGETNADSGNPPADGGGIDDAEAGTTGCPSPQPAGATCCGQHWCVGCDTTACAECEAKGCAASTPVCCSKPGTMQCKTKC